MPSLNCDGDDQEYAGREEEVNTALKEGIDKVDEAVIKVITGKNKKIRNEK